MIDRRRTVGALGALLAQGIGSMVLGSWTPRAAAASVGAAGLRLAAAWRGPRADDPHHVGLLRPDFEARRVAIVAAVPVPSRPHGFDALPDGGVLAVAFRPGRWLLRLDADGRVRTERQLRDDDVGTFDGHVVAAPGGDWLYTTETRRDTGEGCVVVRDARHLRPVAVWPTHGHEPHQLLLDAEGHLMVANGGIRRGPGDRKLDLDRMDASLVRLDGRTGDRLGQWRLPDPRLSIRHLAWAHAVEDHDHRARLGVALQAEHADPAARAQAPVFAVWDGAALTLPTADAAPQGYLGDIAAGPISGYVMSHAQRDAAWWWRAEDRAVLRPVAQLQQAGALAAVPPGADAARPEGEVLIAAARGLVGWHPTRPARVAWWPQAMALDNHLVVLSTPS